MHRSSWHIPSWLPLARGGSSLAPCTSRSLCYGSSSVETTGNKIQVYDSFISKHVRIIYKEPRIVVCYRSLGLLQFLFCFSLWHHQETLAPCLILEPFLTIPVKI
eukprot:XP_024305072.1 lysophosphatidic acid receptor 6 isoform X3 [Homo sapiens]